MTAPRCLFLGASDWANVANRVARAMNAFAGCTTARVWTLEPHPFGYREDLVGRGAMSEAVEWARKIDWLIGTGDGDYSFFFEVARRLPLSDNVRIATNHVGSAYRAMAADYNKADAQVGFDRRFIGGDLYRYALKDRRAVPYFAPPTTVAPWLPDLGAGPVRISHSPSSRVTKGTERIMRVLAEFRGRPDVEIDLIEKVSFDECARRRARTHIFVDQLQPDIGGFGASSVEALGAGCVVLADIRNVVSEVNRFYPRPPIIDVRDEDDLYDRLSALVSNSGFLQRSREASLIWSQMHATPEAVGEYWLSYLPAQGEEQARGESHSTEAETHAVAEVGRRRDAE